VTIIDVRRVFADLTLDSEGFALLEHASAVGKFYDDDEVKRPLLAKLLGEGEVEINLSGMEKFVGLTYSQGGNAEQA
jgi:hypothetical protein